MHDDVQGVFTSVSRAQKTPPRWVVKDVLPEGIVFLVAPPKSQKSTLLMALSALTAQYECNVLPPWMSVVEAPGPTLGFSAEATAGELRDMLETGMDVVLKDDDGILIAEEPFQYRLDDEDGMKKLMHWLDVVDPRIVFFDPLRDFHQAEEKDAGEMNRLLRPLQRWAKEHQACCIIVHHTRKKEGGDQSRYTTADIRGSSSIFGLADGVLVLSPTRNGALDIEATFKRAKSWQRIVMLAAYDNRGKAAHQLLEKFDQMVLYAYASGVKTVEEVAARVKAAKARVLQSVQMLTQNGLLKLDKRSYVLTPNALTYMKEQKRESESARDGDGERAGGGRPASRRESAGEREGGGADGAVRTFNRDYRGRTG
jgi:hypothetical protein